MPLIDPTAMNIRRKSLIRRFRSHSRRAAFALMGSAMAVVVVLTLADPLVSLAQLDDVSAPDPEEKPKEGAPPVKPEIEAEPPKDPEFWWRREVDLGEAGTIGAAFDKWSTDTKVALSSLMESDRPLPTMCPRKGLALPILHRLALAAEVRYWVDCSNHPVLRSCAWSGGKEIFINLAKSDAEWAEIWKTFNDQAHLLERANLRVAKVGTTQVRRIDGHPDAVEELQAWVRFEKLSTSLGAASAPKAAAKAEIALKEDPGSEAATAETANATKARDIMPPPGNRVSSDSGQPAKNGVEKPAGLGPGDLWFKVFQLKYASVEGQSFRQGSSDNAVDLAEVKIPGIANLVTEIAKKVMGISPVTLPSSGTAGGGTTPPSFELARLNAGLALAGDPSDRSVLRNLATTESARAIARALQPVPAPAPAGKETSGIKEDSDIPQQEVTREQVGAYLGTGLEIPPSVEKLTPAGEAVVGLLDRFPQASSITVFGEPERVSVSKMRDLEDLFRNSSPQRGYERSATMLAAKDMPKLQPCIIGERATNRLIVCATVKQLEKFGEIIAFLDKPPRLVEITATILDIDASNRLDWGVDLAGLGTAELSEGIARGRTLVSGGLKYADADPLGFKAPASGVKGSPAGSDLLDFLNPSSSPTVSPPINPAGFSASTVITGTTGRLAARVRALEAQNKVQVLSRPSLLTVNMNDAVFYDKDSLFLPVPGEHNADLFRVNAPIAMRIKPIIMAGPEGKEGNGGILLELEIRDDAVDGGSNLRSPASGGSGSGSTLPIPLIAEGTIHTQAVVQRDQSLLIGGRLRHVQQKVDSGVPILSRVPLLGLAFKDKQARDVKLQRMFLITPREIGLEELTPIPGEALTEP